MHDVECGGDDENGMPRKETEDLGQKDIEKRTKLYQCDKVLSKAAMESRTEPDQRKTMDHAGLRSARGSAYCRSADELGDRRLRQLGLEILRRDRCGSLTSITRMESEKMEARRTETYELRSRVQYPNMFHAPCDVYYVDNAEKRSTCTGCYSRLLTVD